MRNAYCEVLGIEAPRLERLVGARLVVGGRPGIFGLLVMTILERGEPMRLEEIAARLERAGVGPAPQVLGSLKKCRPARPPVFKDGDLYGLDPHSDELDMQAFLFGLIGPRAGPKEGLKVPRPVAPPPPDTEPLSIAELDEAWRGAWLLSWSQQRIALAVLEAHGRGMKAEEVVAFVGERAESSPMKIDAESFVRRNSLVLVRDDGTWESRATDEDMRGVRRLVRDRIATLRRYPQPDRATIEATRREIETKRTAHAAELGALRRAVVHTFPPDDPAAAVLVDVDSRDCRTFLAENLDDLRSRLTSFDVIAGVDVRALLRGLRFDPGARRLADLAPPQKTVTIDKRGRTLRLTTAMLVEGSCRISRALAPRDQLERYLADGKGGKLERRLEADARSLLALYQYGRTHGAVRLRWGFLDEMLPAPWVHRDESVLHHLKSKAHALGVALDVVIGRAPGLEDPWERAQRCRVVTGRDEYDLHLFTDDGQHVDPWDVQLARLAATLH